MTHFECLDVLFGDMRHPDVSGDQAAQHVARCPDCLGRLVALWEERTGTAPPEARRMAELFDCGAVRDRLYALATLDRDVLALREPAAARHLGWCLACRDRFAEMIAADELAAAGALDAGAGERRPWREVVGDAGRTALELAGRLVVRLGAGVPSFGPLPDGMFPVPEPAAAGVRGSADAPLGRVVRRIRLAIDEPRLEVAVLPRGADRADLEVVLEASAGRRSLRLLACRPGAEPELVAVQPIDGGEPTRIRALAAGAYVLELAGGVGPLVRIGLDVEPPPA